MTQRRTARNVSSLAAIAAILALGVSGSALAQEDLSDNATCLDCHAGETWTAPENSDRPRVHTDEGGFFVEAHSEWSCTDCHDYITEIPHADDVTEMSVNCENCHESTPTVQ